MTLQFSCGLLAFPPRGILAVAHAGLKPLFCDAMSGPEPIEDNRSERKTGELRKGRTSVPGAFYFVTFVTENRIPWLAGASARDALKTTWDSWHAEQDGRLLAATVMPDHAHVLLQLWTRHSIGQLIGKWKAEVTRTCPVPGRWQRDFWEHRLRSEEGVEDYALYILLNPYRGGLVEVGESWPGWCLPDGRIFRFAANLGEHGEPPPEWLGWPNERFGHLSTGAE